MPIVKAAMVDKSTNIISNLIMINNEENNDVDGFYVVEIPFSDAPITKEESDLYDLLKEVEPTYVPDIPKVELPVHIGSTKWTVEAGFFEE
jgi:hypothetical protein